MASAAGWGPDQVRQFVLNGVEGSWLGEDEKRRMREDFERELDELDGELDELAAAGALGPEAPGLRRDLPAR